MSRETINLICAELPGAEKAEPRGEEDVWTVGTQPFARIVAEEVVVRRDGAEGRSEGIWVTLPFGTPDAELRRHIVESYELIRGRLPKAVQVTLDRTSG